MECQTSLTLIQESFERALSSIEQRQLDDHLLICMSCRSEAVLLKGVVNAIRETPQELPSHDFTLKVMDRLPVPVSGFLGIPGDVMRVAAAAAIVVATFLSWLYQDSLIRISQQIPQAASMGTDSVSPYVAQIFGRIYGSWLYMATFLPPIDMDVAIPVLCVLIAIGVAQVVLRMAHGFEPAELDEVIN